MNLGTSLHWVSTKMGDKICIIEKDTGVSYSDLWKNIERLAKAFLKIGIKENDKIAILLPNCREFIYSFYAIARINAVSVPLNVHLTAYELKEIFDDCKPNGIITISSLYSQKISSIIAQDCTIIFIDGHIKIKRKIYTFTGLFKIGLSRVSLPDFRTGSDQVASINYTYRGLGKPLGAMLTHGNYHHGAMSYVRLTEVKTEQRVLLVTPMSHIFTLISGVIVSLLRGATIVIMKGFIPTHVFRTIEEKKIDFIIAVPTMYISLLKNYDKGRFNIGTLRYGITGGSYMPPNIYRQIKKEMGIELFQGYGLTETVPVTCNPRSKNKPESLGVPGRKMRVKIVDDKGKEIPVGQKGEIVIGGWSVMSGYYNKNGENRRFLKNGWFWTGDYGHMDEDGYVYFDGLKKDIVKIGGNNVDLREVRDTLGSFQGVRDVKLHVVKDNLWGYQIQAVVKRSSQKAITGKMIKTFCSERLAPYKIPKKIKII